MVGKALAKSLLISQFRGKVRSLESDELTSLKTIFAEEYEGFGKICGEKTEYDRKACKKNDNVWCTRTITDEETTPLAHMSLSKTEECRDSMCVALKSSTSGDHSIILDCDPSPFPSIDMLISGIQDFDESSPFDDFLDLEAEEAETFTDPGDFYGGNFKIAIPSSAGEIIDTADPYVASASTETIAPTETTGSTDTAAPTELSQSTDTDAPTELSQSTDTDAPTEATESTETADPYASSMSTETAAPSEEPLIEDD